MRSAGQAPAISLRSDAGDRWTIGAGTQEVNGTNAALLLWLARGDGARVSSKDALPVLPSWG